MNIKILNKEKVVKTIFSPCYIVESTRKGSNGTKWKSTSTRTRPRVQVLERDRDREGHYMNREGPRLCYWNPSTRT